MFAEVEERIPTTVKLISSDGFEFIIDRKCAMASATIKILLSSPGQFAESVQNEITFRDIKYRQLFLRKFAIWLMYAMFFGAEMPGLLMISKIQSIVINQLGTDATTAASYNAGLSAMNLIGRLLLPTISDFIGRKPLFILSLAVQAILIGILPDMIHIKSIPGFLASAFIIGFFYGSGFGMIPAFLADQFSSKNVGATHGVILTSWSLTGVAGALIFNTILTSESNRLQVSTPEGKPNLIYVYDANLRWVICIVIISFFVCLFIPTNIRIRKLPKIEGEIFKFRFINGRMIRVMRGFKLVQVSKEDEDIEWDKFISSLNL
ncbi:hypothetical protein HK096_004538 [Nowakowskiella sp. JEL0078]|nr:hypothetical protein HK096_004538 [Nowakowskiella sp. JEL0078]